MRQSEDVSASNLDVSAIVEILEELPVTHAILYGSYARGDATATSDIDLAVEYTNRRVHRKLRRTGIDLRSLMTF